MKGAPFSHLIRGSVGAGAGEDHAQEMHDLDRAEVKRNCTCHPDDSPPRPCPQKFALTECREAAMKDRPEDRPNRQKTEIAEAVAAAVAAERERCARIVERWSLPTIQTPSMWLVDQAGIAAAIRTASEC